MDMIDIVMVWAGGLVLGMFWCLYRYVTLMTGWHVAVATVWKSGYSDLERLDDFAHPISSFGTLRGWNIRDDDGMRWTEDEVAFTTAEGQRVRAMVGRQVKRSWKPERVFRVWYNRENPQAVTVHGPGHWLFTALFQFALLIFIFAWGIEWLLTGHPPQWLDALFAAERAAQAS